jgi:hypothetical protein
MATFTAQHSREVCTTIWFEAETEEQAQELLNEVCAEELDVHSLPGFQRDAGKNSGVFELDHLEKVN